MLHELGEITGILIIILYVLTVLTYFFKFISKKFRKVIKKNKIAIKTFDFFFKFIVKYHRLFGISTIAALLIHFILQYVDSGFNVSGTIAAAVMIAQVALGIYGHKTNKKGGVWLLLHRVISVIILIAILLHI